MVWAWEQGYMHTSVVIVPGFQSQLDPRLSLLTLLVPLLIDTTSTWSVSLLVWPSWSNNVVCLNFACRCGTVDMAMPTFWRTLFPKWNRGASVETLPWRYSPKTHGTGSHLYDQDSLSLLLHIVEWHGFYLTTGNRWWFTIIYRSVVVFLVGKIGSVSKWHNFMQ